ncbi:MAG: DUF551 domain-containing protein [Amphritea sp.]|nr:DUF551 domain-containing protein [Amphritea sp.]
MNIDAEFDRFIEFPDDSKAYVTSVSAKLFAKHCIEKQLNASESERNSLSKQLTTANESVERMRGRIEELEAECTNSREVMEQIVNTISHSFGLDPECFLNPDAAIEGMAVEAAEKAGETLQQLLKQFGISFDEDEGEFISSTAPTADVRSDIEKDGLPTFYISTEGAACTHRMSDTDTPVWCRNGDDGMKAMRAVQEISQQKGLLIDHLQTAINEPEIGQAVCCEALQKLDSESTPSAADGWISVDERLPERSGPYWTFCGNEEPSVIQQRVLMFDARYKQFNDCAATHWRKLPAKPAAGG